MRRGLTVFSAGVLAAAGSAGAQAWIVNGGFETGTFAGWPTPIWPGSEGLMMATPG